MQALRPREAAAALLIALVAAGTVASPATDLLRGLSIDLLTALRWRTAAPAPDPAASRAVVVALDEETFRTPPFEGTPSVTWTREIGRVLTAVLEGGAAVVGFDVIFPTSIEQSAVPFGDETLGARVRGFDRDYLRALATGARAGKVVLGQVQHQGEPVRPSPGQRAAVGQDANIRLLNLHVDPDEVVRRLPLAFATAAAPVPSMAVELATRAAGAAPAAGLAQAGAVAGTITLNFRGGAEDIPTYSLADLRACLDKDDKTFFRRNFAGKVVLFGTLLDVEDRKITSKRFATAPERAGGERCALTAQPDAAAATRDSIAGVYIHATAVNNLLNGDVLTEPGRVGTATAAFAIAVIVAGAAFLLGPVGATVALGGISALWTAAATVAFRHALALPLIEPPLAALAALGVTIGYRFVVSDRDRRLLRQSFALYLPPALIEKMMTSKRLPALGGEQRNVTVYFSDVADFSTLSELTSPTELVAAMNAYLSAMTDIIEAHGGFVDKYIGDAIVAVFGAPLDDPAHAENAVSAALACAATLPTLDGVAAAFGGKALRQRIGLNSGAALVGNIGSRRRLNYTAMGDTVNLASRLEGANKFYGTTVMASQATMLLTGTTFAWRELDTLQVKGRGGAVTVLEPLARAGAVPPDQAARAAAYADALACFRARDFDGAIARLDRVAAADPPAARLLARARQFAVTPPPAEWQGVNALDEK